MEQIRKFKNWFFVGIALWALGSNAQKNSSYPKLPKSGMEIQDLIPEGWQVLSEAKGDLNGDGHEDIAFAIQSPVKETIQYTDDFESDTIVTSPRILGIYFGKRNGKFKKVLQSNTFIINRNTPTMDEPFKGLEILPDGEFQILFYIWQCRECTSWSTHVYSFRYRKKAFELVAYYENKAQRVSAEDIAYDIDFENKTMHISTSTVNDETDEQVLETQPTIKFELKKLKTLKSLVKPFEWEFLRLRI
ncbi:hypothetical protein DZC72_02965 [Maribacter algicola]|uniref:VCBS repeat-containing protein n=1 Tax=Maribacter algicola TaxID=2498892 RepID=A0A3R8Q4R8_9FLAO|nr:hypothetical protein [Maribacter algicola]RRQ49579.1 hypothetical protein DZC72_02965 [Maribacter algicola]